MPWMGQKEGSFGDDEEPWSPTTMVLSHMYERSDLISSSAVSVNPKDLKISAYMSLEKTSSASQEQLQVSTVSVATSQDSGQVRA